MKPIQLFVPTFRVDECLAQVRECLEKGWTGLGYKTNEFETRVEGLHGLAARALPQLRHVGIAPRGAPAEGAARLAATATRSSARR